MGWLEIVYADESPSAERIGVAAVARSTADFVDEDAACAVKAADAGGADRGADADAAAGSGAFAADAAAAGERRKEVAAAATDVIAASSDYTARTSPEQGE